MQVTAASVLLGRRSVGWGTMCPEGPGTRLCDNANEGPDLQNECLPYLTPMHDTSARIPRHADPNSHHSMCDANTRKKLSFRWERHSI